MIKLRLPLKHINITQPFGVSYVNFYDKLGLDGHNGVDFRTKTGCFVYSAHDGVVTKSKDDKEFGKYIEIFNKEMNIKTRYGHLSKLKAKEGQEVKAGEYIGLAGNTGKYTSGPHLHFDLKITYENGSTYNSSNGFKGAVNPATYFAYRFNGKQMSPSDWKKSRAYHRYDRGRPKGGYQNEVKVVMSLIPYLKRLPKNEEINACVYGGWDREVLKNPAMRELWSNLKKSEYLTKITPYLDRGVEI